MAKKRKNLPDLSKQNILTPIDLSTMGTNGDNNEIYIYYKRKKDI